MAVEGSSSSSGASGPARTDGGNRLIYAGIAAFVVTCLLALLVSMLYRGGGARDVVSFPEHERAEAASDGTFRATVDTSRSDRWVGYDLTRGRTVQPGQPADLLLRRYGLRAPRGAIDLGAKRLGEAKIAAAGARWVRDHGERNPALAKWYDYSYTAHTLESRKHVYAIRLASGPGVAYLEVLSYYCRPADPEGRADSGCLTLRYRLERSPDG